MAIDWRSVIGLYGLWLVIVVLRIVALWRQSGTTGIRRLSDGPWSADGAARVLFVLAVGVGVASPVLVGAGVLAPASNVDRGEVRIAGLVLAVAGIALLVWLSQRGMQSRPARS